MPDTQNDSAQRLIATAFAEAERRGWRGLTIPALAKRAGLTVAQGYKVAPDMEALLDVYAERIDAKIAEDMASDDAQGPWHERLFDAFMARFDAMLPDREALRVITIEESRSLVGVPRALWRARRSAARTLDAAGLGADPLTARAASLALVPLYARIFQIWLKDEPDQAKTMAALDKALRRLDRWLARAEPMRRRLREAVDESEPAPAEPAPTNGTQH
jgi:AcrR family transcriptional regulator